MSITRLSGTVIDNQKRYQGYGGGSPATSHQEFWLNTPSGKEAHVHLVNDEVPLRKGHKVEVFFQNGFPVGLINYTTDQYVNFQARYHVMPDHPEYQPWEGQLLRPSRIAGLLLLLLIVYGLVDRIWEGYGPLPVVVVVITYAVWESWRHREKPDKIIHNENHGVVEDAILAALDEYRQRRTQGEATNGR